MSGISTGHYRVNEQIRAREVRLITDTNQHMGIVPVPQALSTAEERGLDLVEVSPMLRL